MYVGVVVLYNPESEQVIKNISSYINNLDHLLIIDNSDVESKEIIEYFRQNEKVTYTCLKENKGIAYALNRGIDFAKKHDGQWLLTMDQDSSFPANEFGRFVSFVQEHKDVYKDAAIFSPLHKVPYLQKEKGITKVRSVMTSGNLLNMNLIDKIGYFDEKLFIDSVDHEYCYRINQKGYSVYRVNDIELVHNLGELAVKVLFGKKLFVTNHNYIRRYYITRNFLYVNKVYSNYSKLGFAKFVVSYLYWTFLTITFFEKNKMLKYKSMWTGLLDYKNGKFGKITLNRN
ncbi:glycosyltransferase family 2 protein [Neobacillus pocheonensis]|uniref:Glycosyltransferase family 2 protein n=1 Tax=Neobacillus pocheonensis TaxID=363869 RepID=A0ABT0WHZ9_9BACI|nr:glycosyltransferase family 2 protein [Neobacillus pocheonensis]